ncbi:hypothetical protein PHMEG_00030361 [Phytophthora megakarya]|uniref:Eukaryotic/viral aspartic protease n=1 Tax=Phytophthora megakarya TaxID=4795 RepID=A0A225V1A1_9STRA|nr:hypothetical protein PHMEG_00030361 [Phytophthora megakarya]
MSRLRTTTNDEQPLTGLSLEAISVHNKVEHLQVDLIKVAIDLLLVKVRDSVTIVVDEASRNLSMDRVPPVEVSIIRPTIASVHDAGQCEAFNELAKILRAKVDKNDISPGTTENCLRWTFKLGCLPGLDLIGQPQSAERVIDADCIYAFISKCNYPDEDNDYCMNTTGFEKERGISLGGGELDLETEAKITQDGDEYRWGKVAETGSMVSVHVKMVKLLPGELMGWWKSKRFDQRVRMRAIVRGAVNDVRIPILGPTLAKRLRLQQIRGHGRQLEVQGIKKGKMSTSIRVAAKITLGWNTVYELDFWVMEVVMGTNFMIPAGIRLDLFHATAKLLDEVMIPLVKAQNFDDEIPEGMHVPGGPNDNLPIAAGEWVDYLQRNKPSLGTHDVWVRRTPALIPTITKFRKGQPTCVRLTNISHHTEYCPAHLSVVMWVPRGYLPKMAGYVQVGSPRYEEWQVLVYAGARDETLFQWECELYERWLASQQW